MSLPLYAANLEVRSFIGLFLDKVVGKTQDHVGQSSRSLGTYVYATLARERTFDNKKKNEGREAGV